MSAPLHFDEFHNIHGGWVEFLAHKFTLRVAQPGFEKTSAGKDDRAALLAAFDAARVHLPRRYRDPDRVLGQLAAGEHPPVC